MADQTITPNEIEISIRALLDQFTGERTPFLRQFAAAQTQRAATLAEAERQLTARLGAEHPRVAAVRASLAAANELKAALVTTSERVARRPLLKENEWMVSGQVLDTANTPVAGVRVRVFDRDRKFDDLLGDTTTDEFGDFAVVYHQRDFLEAGEALPELYVMVSDARGNLLYTSRNSVRMKSGRVEYFEIILNPTPPEPPKDTPPDSPPPKRGPSPSEQPTIKRVVRKAK